MQLSEVVELILSRFLDQKKCNSTITQNHYYSSILIILRCKKDDELKELPNNIMKIAHICQKYNTEKIFISSIMTCTKTFTNIAKTNEGIKNMCILNNFEHVKHNQTTVKNL